MINNKIYHLKMKHPNVYIYVWRLDKNTKWHGHKISFHLKLFVLLHYTKITRSIPAWLYLKAPPSIFLSQLYYPILCLYYPTSFYLYPPSNIPIQPLTKLSWIWWISGFHVVFVSAIFSFSFLSLEREN